MCDRGEMVVYQKIMKLESDNKNESKDDKLMWQSNMVHKHEQNGTGHLDRMLRRKNN